MKIVKVFTKYDEPFECIHVPYIEQIKAMALDEVEFPPWEPIPLKYFDLLNTKIEEGLEGVRFYHYT